MPAFAIHDNSQIRPDIPPVWLRFPSIKARDAFVSEFPKNCHPSDIGPDESQGVWRMTQRYGGTNATKRLAVHNGLMFSPHITKG